MTTNHGSILPHVQVSAISARAIRRPRGILQYKKALPACATCLQFLQGEVSRGLKNTRHIEPLFVMTGTSAYHHDNRVTGVGHGVTTALCSGEPDAPLASSVEMRLIAIHIGSGFLQKLHRTCFCREVAATKAVTGPVCMYVCILPRDKLRATRDKNCHSNLICS